MVLKRREYKGIKLASQDHVQQINSSKFLVRSEKELTKNYEVSWVGKHWVCTCEDYRKRRKRCKHIHAVSYYLAVKSFVPALKSSLRFEQSCPNCGSTQAIISHGWRYNKSEPVKRCLCKCCGTTFADRRGFEGMKNRAMIIVTALDLYFRGLSLRKISEHLETLYKIKVSYTSIHYWLSKYVELVHNFLEGSCVETSGRWHADDTLIRLKGRHMVLWSILDSETRLLIAKHVSERRTSKEASKVLEKGCFQSRIPKDKPLELITDGLPSYAEAVEKQKASGVMPKPVVHIHGPLTGPVNNNKMERLFGTLKERAKLALHFNNEAGASLFAEGFATHYNYVRGHMALGGRTPAEAAGLTKRKLSWLDLIEEASKKSKRKL